MLRASSGPGWPLGLRTRPRVNEGATLLLSGGPHPVRRPSEGRAVRPQKDHSEGPEHKRQNLGQAGEGLGVTLCWDFLRWTEVRQRGWKKEASSRPRGQRCFGRAMEA